MIREKHRRKKLSRMNKTPSITMDIVIKLGKIVTSYKTIYLYGVK